MQNCTDITICEFLMESQVRVLSVVCWHLTVGIVMFVQNCTVGSVMYKNCTVGIVMLKCLLMHSPLTH